MPLSLTRTKVASTSAMEVDHTPFYRAMEVMNGPVQEMGEEGTVISVLKLIVNDSEKIDVDMVDKVDAYKQSLLQRAAQVSSFI